MASRFDARQVTRCSRRRVRKPTGSITPKDTLLGRQQQTHAERDRKREAARQQRQSRRQQAARRAKRPGHRHTCRRRPPRCNLGVSRAWNLNVRIANDSGKIRNKPVSCTVTTLHLREAFRAGSSSVSLGAGGRGRERERTRVAGRSEGARTPVHASVARFRRACRAGGRNEKAAGLSEPCATRSGKIRHKPANCTVRALCVQVTPDGSKLKTLSLSPTTRVTLHTEPFGANAEEVKYFAELCSLGSLEQGTGGTFDELADHLRQDVSGC